MSKPTTYAIVKWPVPDPVRAAIMLRYCLIYRQIGRRRSHFNPKIMSQASSTKLDIENNSIHATAFLAAASSFLTEWPDDWTASQLADALCEEETPEDVTVWEPFEHWTMGRGDGSLYALIVSSTETVLRACAAVKAQEDTALRAYLTEISVRWGDQVVDRKHVIQAYTPEEAATATLHKECSYVGCEPADLQEESNGWYSGTMEHFFYGPVDVKEIDPRDAVAVLRYLGQP